MRHMLSCIRVALGEKTVRDLLSKGVPPPHYLIRLIDGTRQHNVSCFVEHIEHSVFRNYKQQEEDRINLRVVFFGESVHQIASLLGVTASEVRTNVIDVHLASSGEGTLVLYEEIPYLFPSFHIIRAIQQWSHTLALCANAWIAGRA